MYIAVSARSRLQKGAANMRTLNFIPRERERACRCSIVARAQATDPWCNASALFEERENWPFCGYPPIRVSARARDSVLYTSAVPDDGLNLKPAAACVARLFSHVGFACVCVRVLAASLSLARFLGNEAVWDEFFSFYFANELCCLGFGFFLYTQHLIVFLRYKLS